MAEVMMGFSPMAVELNEAIAAANPAVLGLLSRRGKAIYFPSKGIIQQTRDAKGASINATIGSALEDDGGPMCLEVLRRQVSLEPGLVFSYAPPDGQQGLRDEWQKALHRKNPSLKGTAVSRPLVTCALTHGLSTGGYLFVDEGDELILPDLFWGNYRLIYENAYGAKLTTYPLFSGDGYNIEGLRSRLTAGTPGKRIVLLNFPNNPTGYTVTNKEAVALRDVLVEAADAGNSIVVLVDDAYFGLVYEGGVLTESMFGLLAGAHERILAVKFDGPTKEDYVWGFRVGFVTFGCRRNSPALYDALEKKMAAVVRGSISNVSNLTQSLLLHAYRDPSYAGQKKEKYGILRRRYERVRAILSEHPEYGEGVEALPFNSGYFMCLTTRPGIDPEELRQRLLRTYGVGVIAAGRVVRIAYSSTPYDALGALFDSVYRAGREIRKSG